MMMNEVHNLPEIKAYKLRFHDFIKNKCDLDKDSCIDANKLLDMFANHTINELKDTKYHELFGVALLLYYLDLDYRDILRSERIITDTYQWLIHGMKWKSSNLIM